METNLWVIRIKSFGWELLSVVITAVLGYASSDHVRELLNQYTGTTIVSTLLGLVIIGITKHLRNKRVIAAAEQTVSFRAELGSGTASEPFNLI